MNWRQEYEQKLVSAEEAVKIVQSGEKVSFGFPRQPTLLTAALAARSEELQGMEMLLENPRVDDGWLQPEKKKTFYVIMDYLIGPVMRKWTVICVRLPTKTTHSVSHFYLLITISIPQGMSS